MANNKEKYQQIVNSEIYLTRILDNVVTGPQKESCWTLTNKKSIFWFNGTSIRAQIFFYYHSAPNKEIPIGYQVSAKCNNPYCINPNHLELLTRSAIRKKLINSGWQHSKATKQKMSKSHKGLKLSEKTIKKIVAKTTGLERSFETKDKMSKAHMGKKLSTKHRKKLSKAKIGKMPHPKTLAALKHFHIGENNHKAKLTEADVLQIRSLQGTISAYELSCVYPVTEDHIQKSIWKRRSWKHI